MPRYRCLSCSSCCLSAATSLPLSLVSLQQLLPLCRYICFCLSIAVSASLLLPLSLPICFCLAAAISVSGLSAAVAAFLSLCLSVSLPLPLCCSTSLSLCLTASLTIYEGLSYYLCVCVYITACLTLLSLSIYFLFYLRCSIFVLCLVSLFCDFSSLNLFICLCESQCSFFGNKKGSLQLYFYRLVLA